MHVDLAIVAGAGKSFKTHFFVVVDIFSASSGGLILFDVLFGLHSDLQPTDLVIPVNQLVCYVSTVDHELYLPTDDLVPNARQ